MLCCDWPVLYELTILSQNRVIAQFACFHGSKVSIATSLYINAYCHKEYFCQIST